MARARGRSRPTRIDHSTGVSRLVVAVAAIGVDLCDVERIRRALEGSAGARFRDRVFTPAEQDYCERRRRMRFQSYAARFAAKEAAMKALGTGWSRGVRFRDVEVLREADESPTLRLHGEAAALAQRLGIARWLVTLSHTATSAVACVLAERGAPVTAAGPVAAARRRGAAAGSRRQAPRSRR